MFQDTRVLFRSIQDPCQRLNLVRAACVLEKYKEGWQAENINDIIELYQICELADHNILTEEWGATDTILIDKFKRTILCYFENIVKQNFVGEYQKIEHPYHDSFWNIISNYQIRGIITVERLLAVNDVDRFALLGVLRNRVLVKNYDKQVLIALKVNSHAAEWLLSKYIEKGSDQRSAIHVPSSITEQDINEIINSYLDQEQPNLNYVSLICNAKNIPYFKLKPQTIVKAKRKEKFLIEQLFKKSGNGIPLKYKVVYTYDENAKLYENFVEDGTYVYQYNANLLINTPPKYYLYYIKHFFEFTSSDDYVNLVNKLSEQVTLENFMGIRSKYDYYTNITFKQKELLSYVQIQAMQNALKNNGSSIEEGIIAFYEDFLKEQYNYPSHKLCLATPDSSWVIKCRSLAPEIDAIAKRYEMFATEGYIDTELLAYSDLVRITNVHSSISNNYYLVNAQNERIKSLFFYLFSDQAMLTYVDPFKESYYKNFFIMLIKENGNIKYDNYEIKQDLQYLLDEGLIRINNKGFIEIAKEDELYILSELYQKRACHYNTCNGCQHVLDDYYTKDMVFIDNHLLSPEEKDFFSYYMYDEFKNSRGYRNKYVHGETIEASEEYHEHAYYRLLILLILELLKIDFDLKTKQYLESQQ